MTIVVGRSSAPTTFSGSVCGLDAVTLRVDRDIVIGGRSRLRASFGDLWCEAG
jgi:hypothetical protein